jgi:hypothetical protein
MAAGNCVCVVPTEPHDELKGKPREFSVQDMFEEIAESTRLERRSARRRQLKAGIDHPVRFDSRRPEDPELAAGRDILWQAANPVGATDPVLLRLETMVNRGLACMTESDFLAFTKLRHE